MAKLTKEEFIKSLNEMSIFEVKELVDAMKEEYGVDEPLKVKEWSDNLRSAVK